jgi:hypothetical protein
MTKAHDLIGQKFNYLTVIRIATAEEKGSKKGSYWLCRCDCGNEKIILGQDLINGTTKACGCKKGIREDITGKRFGKLLVLSFSHKNKNGETIYLCKCDCGSEKLIRRLSLASGNTKSCGCLSNEKRADFTGKTFGKLIVIERTSKPENSNKKDRFWLCKCECGNIKVVSSYNLRSGVVKSCGCLISETAKETGRKNAIDRKPYNVLPFGEAALNSKYRGYQNNAKSRGHSFELTIEEFFDLSQQVCYYCGSEPSSVSKNYYGKGDFIYNGIDRWNNSIGYKKENCVPCCGTCNYMKRTLSGEEFYKQINKIFNYKNNKEEINNFKIMETE